MYIERLYYIASEVTTTNGENNAPQFVKEYTQDNFGSYPYKWKWQLYKYDLWYMIDLRQYCPHDDTPLDHQICPRCKIIFPAGEHHEQIEALVADNIKKKYGNENISPPGEFHIYIKG